MKEVYQFQYLYQVASKHQQILFRLNYRALSPFHLKGLNEVTSPSKKPELSIDANICRAAILIAVRDVCGLIEIFQQTSS